MKTFFQLVISLAVVCLLGLAGGATSAPLGTSFTYQGVLSDGGVPASGAFDFRFTLVDAVSGGSTVAGPLAIEDATASSGRVSIELDFGDVFDGTALWLVVEVRDGASEGSYTTLNPPQKLSAAPQARYAVAAAAAADAANLNGQPPAYYRAWSSLTDVPDGLDDGDDDTLGDLACATGQIARWSGTAWTCTEDDDPLPVLANTIYVAINGSPTGPGTVEQPLDTAQAGYDAAAAAFPGVTSTVVLMGGGSYGSLNMHAGTVHVLGQSRSELADLTVSAGIPSPPIPPPGIAGKQRVENVIVNGPAMVAPNGAGAWVKFHNCRFLDGLVIDESYVEVHDCAVQLASLSVPAVDVGPSGVPITEVGIYQSSLLASTNLAGPGTLPGTLTVGPLVMDFEVIGCQIVNEGGVVGGTAPAILDLSPGIAPPQPLHLYSHNVIKGPPSGIGAPAVADFLIGLPQPAGPTIVFTHNTVHGDVGGAGGVALPAGTLQFFANNTIYGAINFAGPGAVVGWAQAGAGLGLDGAGNAEHPAGWGPGGFTLPSHFDD